MVHLDEGSFSLSWPYAHVHGRCCLSLFGVLHRFRGDSHWLRSTDTYALHFQTRLPQKKKKEGGPLKKKTWRDERPPRTTSAARACAAGDDGR